VISLPFGRKRTTVGLDVGSRLVKVAVIQHGSGGPQLAKVAITPLSSDAIVEGEVMDPAVVTDAIRSTLEAAGVRQTEVVTAVGGRDVIVKRIQTDRVRENDARELIQLEAQQHVPFDDMDSVELDFQILEGSRDEDKMDVLLVAAKRDLIEARLRLLTDAGLTPSIVDVDAFALHNAFELNYPEAMHGVVALLNIGHDVTNVNVLENGFPVVTRDMPTGTRRFREDLQREIGMAADDAEAAIQGYDASSHLSRMVENRADEIAAGVERAAGFLFASGVNSGQAFRSVYICGGGARTPGLDSALGRRLGAPVQLASALRNLQMRDGALDSLNVEEVAPLLMLPIGLALRH
jgi:type IV pilus assembly protein PilM